MAPKAAGVVALTRSVSECGVSGTMTEIVSAIGSAAQRCRSISIFHADCTRWRQPGSSPGGRVRIGSV